MLVLRSNSCEEFVVDFLNMRVSANGKQYILMCTEKIGIGFIFEALVFDLFDHKNKYICSKSVIKSINEK